SLGSVGLSSTRAPLTRDADNAFSDSSVSELSNDSNGAPPARRRQHSGFSATREPLRNSRAPAKRYRSVTSMRRAIWGNCPRARGGVRAGREERGALCKHLVWLHQKLGRNLPAFADLVDHLYGERPVPIQNFRRPRPVAENFCQLGLAMTHFL